MEGLGGSLMSWVTMICVGGLAGAIAARVIKGDSFGFIINALLGIAGAFVGTYLFGLLKMTPGAGLVRTLKETFDVAVPQHIVGLIISATVGSIIILLLARMLGLGKRKR